MTRSIAILLALCALLAQAFGPVRDARALALALDPFAHPPICSPSGEPVEAGGRDGGTPGGTHSIDSSCCSTCHLPQASPLPDIGASASPTLDWVPAAAPARVATQPSASTSYRPHNPRGPPARS